MNIWYNFLQESIGDDIELDNYSDIFYLSSCSNFDLKKLDEAIADNNIYKFLSNCDTDSKKDSMEFFLAIDSIYKNKFLIIIYNPVELLEAPVLYKIINYSNSEDYKSLLHFEIIK